MRSSDLLFLGMVGGVLAGAMSSSWGAAWGTNNTSISYTTITTTAFTTYCPEATVLTHGGFEYTVTEATTLTITDCPCTLTQPVTKTLTPTTILYTSCSSTPINTNPPPPPNTNLPPPPNTNLPPPPNTNVPPPPNTNSPPNPTAPVVSPNNNVNTDTNAAAKTQTAIQNNAGEVTVTNQLATGTPAPTHGQQNGGVVGTGTGGVGNYSQVVGAGSRAVGQIGAAALGAVAIVAFAL
ncbi:hypothetical protein BDZ45DRAFT_722624 [Acephala macrosclerotiorum]|nr:hypothetical protein BDZ45DRAFT_722624 [Acephala macrosclerotiorum]